MEVTFLLKICLVKILFKLIYKTKVVLEKIDLLKAVKANYEDVEDALNEKADLSELNRKVSIGKFDEAFEENVKTIEEILRKLQELEELCQNNLNEIQLELAVKPNRSDLDTVQELLMKRINELKLRLKSLTALKEEQEASGAKNPYLRLFNLHRNAFFVSVLFSKQSQNTLNFGQLK